MQRPTESDIWQTDSASDAWTWNFVLLGELICNFQYLIIIFGLLSWPELLGLTIWWYEEQWHIGRSRLNWLYTVEEGRALLSRALTHRVDWKLLAFWKKSVPKCPGDWYSWIERWRITIFFIFPFINSLLIKNIEFLLSIALDKISSIHKYSYFLINTSFYTFSLILKLTFLKPMYFNLSLKDCPFYWVDKKKMMTKNALYINHYMMREYSFSLYFAHSKAWASMSTSSALPIAKVLNLIK